MLRRGNAAVDQTEHEWTAKMQGTPRASGKQSFYRDSLFVHGPLVSLRQRSEGRIGDRLSARAYLLGSRRGMGTEARVATNIKHGD